jgi:hypothetical protein
MRQMIIALALIGLSAYLSAQQQNVSKRSTQQQPALFNPGRANAPEHDVWRLAPSHSTANLFVGSGANPEAFDVGTRVGGTVLIDRTEPSDSRFDLSFYPAGVGGPTGPDGKLANGWNPNAFSDTELIFKSTRTLAASQGTLMVSGDLTLVRIEPSVNVVLSEAYVGPTYGNPVVHTATHHLTLLLVVAPDGSRPNTPVAVAGTFRVARQDFAGLRSTVLHASWPTAVGDRHCQVISSSGERFGPSCSGETVSLSPEPITPTGDDEDFHGFEGAPPTGSRVTIDFSLVMVPATSSLSAGPKSGGGSAFLGFNGDVLFKPFFKGNLVVQAEVNWKGRQGMYGGQIPCRRPFYDSNAMYARRFSKYFGAEAQAGIGGESIRFYSNSYNDCDSYGHCTSYVSSSHFMDDFGRGIHFYSHGNFFVRPEMRLHLINNNEEFRFEPSSSLWCLDWLRSRREQIRSDMSRCALTRWQWESSVLQ